MLIEAIKQVKSDGNYPFLNTLTDNNIVDEYEFIKSRGIALKWTEESWQAYKRTSRVGRKLPFNREMRGKFFAAITEVEEVRLKNIKAQNQLRARNSTPKMKYLEDALLGDEENS